MHSPNLFVTILAFVAILGPLVFVHELGHYLVARWCGVRSETFSIGFGKEIAGWTDKAGTRWKLGLLPLGGYVQFAGDMNPASGNGDIDPNLSPAQRAQLFQTQPVWQRAAIVAAGPAINFAFAFVLLMGLALTFGESRSEPVVGTVATQSAAAQSGLQPGDRIIAIDGKSVDRFEDISRIVLLNVGTPMRVELDRHGTVMERQVTPRITPVEDRFGTVHRIAMIGIGQARMPPQPVTLIEAPEVAVRQMGDALDMMTRGLGQIVRGQRSLKELGGPIQIAKQSGESASLGVPVFIWFMAMLSINLGFINLLPLPLLDGGHLLFYAIEAVRRRPADKLVQEWAFRLGFALVATLFIVVTFNDLGSIGAWRRLTDLIG